MSSKKLKDFMTNTILEKINYYTSKKFDLNTIKEMLAIDLIDIEDDLITLVDKYIMYVIWLENNHKDKSNAFIKFLNKLDNSKKQVIDQTNRIQKQQDNLVEYEHRKQDQEKIDHYLSKIFNKYKTNIDQHNSSLNSYHQQNVQNQIKDDQQIETNQQFTPNLENQLDNSLIDSEIKSKDLIIDNKDLIANNLQVETDLSIIENTINLDSESEIEIENKTQVDDKLDSYSTDDKISDDEEKIGDYYKNIWTLSEQNNQDEEIDLNDDLTDNQDLELAKTIDDINGDLITHDPEEFATSTVNWNTYTDDRDDETVKENQNDLDDNLISEDDFEFEEEITADNDLEIDELTDNQELELAKTIDDINGDLITHDPEEFATSTVNWSDYTDNSNTEEEITSKEDDFEFEEEITADNVLEIDELTDNQDLELAKTIDDINGDLITHDPDEFATSTINWSDYTDNQDQRIKDQEEVLEDNLIDTKLEETQFETSIDQVQEEYVLELTHSPKLGEKINYKDKNYSVVGMSIKKDENGKDKPVIKLVSNDGSEQTTDITFIKKY
ncbi:hypothetical protein [Mycoplasma yeatsii]|uniref:Uncharacterized protein n=1 Tax=Mycoplasma yeatsii TaxID=51365 RepID=A0ABU0NEZ7_9MOLU|nr:hypothetical protein [Mycoplasma yeatsii]MDQ0568023.1 hypothetical protein [Mycoplasma yeatsii]